MSGFEFYFSFFGLLMGLTVAEVATKFADAIGARSKVALGLLTPLLAIFILFDVSGLWLYAWASRDALEPSWPMVYGGLVVSLAYFLSAALVFPRQPGEWRSLDEYYWIHKRIVLGGVLVANLIALGYQFYRVPVALNDFWAFFYQAVYYVPLTALIFARSRRVNLVLLGFLVAWFIISLVDILPHSAWGDQSGLNGDVPQAASTSGTGASR
ncbi:MAG: hypothetical protein V4659_00300 [Pseudomonadota bacterium]